MFGKEKEKNNIDYYIDFIIKTIKDEEIKEEIIKKINEYFSFGAIKIDGYNLTGKGGLVDSYLDIKYEAGNFVCLYADMQMKSMVLIEQKKLKDGIYKIKKTDKKNFINQNNEYYIKIEEKIYNENNQLLYKSENKVCEESKFYKDRLVYTDNALENIFRMERTWYMPNGSIIKYKMFKYGLYNKDGIEKEEYLISEKPCKTENGFSSIPRELFISVMTGELTIEEALESLNKKDPVKKMEKKDDKKNSNK